jgi:hypothetical protein
VLTGGVVNADELRTVPAAVNFVQRIFGPSRQRHPGIYKM